MQPIYIALVIAAAAVSVSARNVPRPESVMRELPSSDPITLTGNFENFRFTPTTTAAATTTSDDAAQPTTSATRTEFRWDQYLKSISRNKFALSHPMKPISATPDVRATDA